MTLPPEDRPDQALPPRPPATSEPAYPAVGDAPAAIEPPAPEIDPLLPIAGRQPYTRIRAAWVGVWAGILAVILLIVFVGQNTAPVEVHFLWLDGNIPTALALLIAGVGGAVIAMAVAAARILQLRRTIRRPPP
jgi:uncharacterized integral membrane protein